MKSIRHLVLAALTAIACAAERPNFVVILTDDLGFSDLGCYGSEIETPNLDRLAAGGLRFSSFSNTAKCHSSRVSLLTGRWCLQAGDTAMDHAVTLPEVLSKSGYSTLMTGKWHLDKQPTDYGFDRYWGHLSGATRYFKGDNTFRLDGKPWKVPDDGFYTTVANVDFALRLLDDARKTEKPWFLYIAFNAPHAPLQPMEQDYRKYEGRYDAGWDIIRERRLRKQKEIGLFAGDVDAGPRPDHVRAWNELTADQRDWEIRRMTALAAMIDRVDQETGRLVDNLAANGELDNTVILFVSDNGACPYDRKSAGRNKKPWEPGASWSDSTGWAWARNSPFRYYKQNQFEGGVATPAIVHWPAGLKAKPGSVNHDPAHLVDVLPTLAGLAGAEIPTTWPGRKPTALAGTTLEPVLAGPPLGERPPIHYLFSTDRGLREGNWKLVSFRSAPWELYDLSEDRAEQHDLAAQEPERVAAMVRRWHETAADALRSPQKSVREAARAPHRHPEWTKYGARK
ncbi:MAG: arylsulfatase [Akkermansiaceae bacterium]|nr:arylsulfatase [Akkermansiaceae bacterium]